MEQLGLTPQEVEVLALVAAGRSDRQIAQALFISPKTVGGHVSTSSPSWRWPAGWRPPIAHRLGLD